MKYQDKSSTVFSAAAYHYKNYKINVNPPPLLCLLEVFALKTSCIHETRRELKTLCKHKAAKVSLGLYGLRL